MSRTPRTPVTVSIVFVRGMLAALRLRGIAPQEWLLGVGIAPDLLDEPAARVTAEQYTALFRALIDGFDDEGLGFFSRPLRRGSLALMMRSVLGARTVEIALRRICRAFDLLQDDVSFALASRDGLAGVGVEVPPAYVPERTFVHEMLLRILLRQVAWLYGGHLNGLEFDFATPRPPYAHEFTKLFPGVVRFDQPRTALWFDAAVLAQPLRHDEASLREFLAGTPDSVVAPQRSLCGVSGRVRTCLLQARPRWLGLEEVADALHMAVSTLQHHLATEGTTFQVLKDDLRRDVAIQRLNSSTAPLAALALELGFSDSATFQRAFKIWTGSAPGAYRFKAAAQPTASSGDLTPPVVPPPSQGSKASTM